jgi:hypothetical protein
LLVYSGIRADWPQAIYTLFPYWKSGMFALIGTGALLTAVRLGLPGRGMGLAGPILIAVGSAGLLAFIGGALITSPDRAAMVQALDLESRSFCLASVALLGTLVLIISAWSMRRLAFIRPRLAGAMLGLAAGALIAAAYAWHCPHDQPLYVGVWYTTPIVLLAGLGAVLGGRLFRM